MLLLKKVNPGRDDIFSPRSNLFSFIEGTVQ